MNKEQVAGKFEQMKGYIKKTWGKLTDNDIMLYNGQEDQFYGKVKEHYGIAREDAEKNLKEFEKSFNTALKDDEKAA